MDPVVSYVRFTDAEWRAVYEDDRGQYVIDADDGKVRGLWYIPPEECVIPTVAVETKGPD